MDTDDTDNGLILNDSIFIPREILAHILRFVHPHTLVHSCRLVCRSWNEITQDDAWKSIVLPSSNLNSVERRQIQYPYPFGRNLLRNNCGQDGLEHWLVKEPIKFWDASCNWIVENVPVGADPLPSECGDFGGYSSCFATSYRQLEKEQEIDLYQNGISAYLMDVWQPRIIVSEWFAGRYDCGCWYQLKVLLLNKNRETLHQQSECKRVEQWRGRDWQKVTIEFENYGPGVRFIVFQHAGKDTKYWAGHYGSKMAGGVVRFSISSGKPRRGKKREFYVLKKEREEWSKWNFLPNFRLSGK